MTTNDRDKLMGVKDAVRKAKEYVADTFSEESIEHLGLEEIVFDETAQAWKVTVGFFRPWNRPPNLSLGSALLGDNAWKQRSFKVVHIEDWSGRILSLNHRSLGAAD